MSGEQYGKLRRPLICGAGDCEKIATTPSEAHGGTPWPVIGKGWTYSRRAGYRCPDHKLPDSLNWVMGP